MIMGAFFSNTGVQIYSMSHTFHVFLLLLFSNKTRKVGIALPTSHMKTLRLRARKGLGQEQLAEAE